MSDVKEPGGFAGLSSPASNPEEDAPSPTQGEIEADERPPDTEAEQVQATARTASQRSVADDEVNPKGFTALSLLAYEAPTERSTAAQGRPEADTDGSGLESPAAETADTPRSSTTAGPVHAQAEAREPIATDPMEASRARSPPLIWLWMILIVLAAIVVFDAVRQREGQTGSNIPQIDSDPQAPAPRRLAQLSDLEFSKPPVGRDHRLSMAEIRWCLREDIRIETLRPLLPTKLQSGELDQIVSDYESRCGGFRDRQETLERARAEVDQHRSEIVDSVSQPWTRSPAQTAGDQASSGPETDTASGGRLAETDGATSRRENSNVAPGSPRRPETPSTTDIQEGETTMAQAPPRSSPTTEPADASPVRETGTEPQAPGRPAEEFETPGLESKLTDDTRSGPSATGIAPEPADGFRDPGTNATVRASEQDRQVNPVESIPSAETADGVSEPGTTRAGQAYGGDQDTESAERGPAQEGAARPDALGTPESVEETPADRRRLIRDIQRSLKALGYEPGPIDGLYGPQTKRAIQAFEGDIGMTPTGDPTTELWRRVQREIMTGRRP